MTALTKGAVEVLPADARFVGMVDFKEMMTNEITAPFADGLLLDNAFESETEARIPDGLRPEDILVSVPLQNAYRTLIGGGSLHRLVLVIRPGGDPRVVAL